MFHPPGNIKARPTTDFAKENLFNILGNRLDFQGSSALDLFAGTGNISFELVSRGCEQVTAVEKEISHVRFIQRVKQQLEIDNLKVIRTDAFRYLEKQPEPFHIIFADPPYHMDEAAQIPPIIFRRGLLRNNGVLILEHDKDLNIKDSTYLSDQRKYGTVHFSFFSFPPEDPR